jgi:NAD+ synthetase
MKVAVAQINTVVGDISGNSDKVVQFATKAKEMGSELVIFPEMTLSGFPPGDVLHRSGLAERNVAALNDIAQRTTSIACVVGFVDKNPLTEGNPFYNAAAILEEGQIQHIAYKSHLPRHDYFDQTRYFEPAVGISPIKFKDKRITVTIGEDLWDDPSTGLPMGFQKQLLGEIAKKKVELVINLMASPYCGGLDKKRVEILKNQATAWKVPIVMCNLVGGNDELVFDGSSAAVSAGGEVIARGKSFQEDLMFVDLVYGAGDIHEEDRAASEMIYRALVTGIRDYASKSGFSQAVLLLNGGLASAVVACAAAEALGGDKLLAVIPEGSSIDPAAREDAAALAGALGARSESISAQSYFEAALGSLAKAFGGARPDATEGNLYSRCLNAAVLAISNKHKMLPLSALTRTDALVGGATLYGHLTPGLAPVGDLARSAVRAVALEAINRDKPRIPASVLNRPSGAEFKGLFTPEEIAESTVEQVAAHYFDEAKSAEEIAAGGLDRAQVDRVIQKIEGAEFKRRQAPLCLRVGTNLLKPPRRYPVARKR